MAKVKAQTTLRDEPFEVDEDEIGSLRAQGILVEDKPKPKADDKEPVK